MWSSSHVLNNLSLSACILFERRQLPMLERTANCQYSCIHSQAFRRSVGPVGRLSMLHLSGPSVAEFGTNCRKKELNIKCVTVFLELILLWYIVF